MLQNIFKTLSAWHLFVTFFFFLDRVQYFWLNTLDSFILQQFSNIGSTERIKR